MPDPSVPEVAAAPPRRRFTRSVPGLIGLGFLVLMAGACLVTLPYTLGGSEGSRYKLDDPRAVRLPPCWVAPGPEEAHRLNTLVAPAIAGAVAERHGLTRAALLDPRPDAAPGPLAELREHWPRYWLGTDLLGRSMLIRSLAGGGVSLGIGIAAAMISVLIGTFYGALAGYAGGTTDAVMMRIVDILYGLPYVLLVVLLAVASDAALDEYLTRSHARAGWMERQAAQIARDRGLPADRAAVRGLIEADGPLKEDLEARALDALPPRTIGDGTRTLFDVGTLLVAIGGVSWLTMARVVRGQVLSLKNQPFMEAARAIGVPWSRQFTRHLLPNLVGPIVVYATLTVPQAILQESFLSFLGIGVKPPLPSWGNLAADGLGELNRYKSHWWLLLFPCVLLGLTLLALNFVGEGLREALDPRSRRR